MMKASWEKLRQLNNSTMLHREFARLIVSQKISSLYMPRSYKMVGRFNVKTSKKYGIGMAEFPKTFTPFQLAFESMVKKFGRRGAIKGVAQWVLFT